MSDHPHSALKHIKHSWQRYPKLFKSTQTILVTCKWAAQVRSTYILKSKTSAKKSPQQIKVCLHRPWWYTDMRMQIFWCTTYTWKPAHWNQRTFFINDTSNLSARWPRCYCMSKTPLCNLIFCRSPREFGAGLRPAGVWDCKLPRVIAWRPFQKEDTKSQSKICFHMLVQKIV